MHIYGAESMRAKPCLWTWSIQAFDYGLPGNEQWIVLSVLSLSVLLSSKLSDRSASNQQMNHMENIKCWTKHVCVFVIFFFNELLMGCLKFPFHSPRLSLPICCQLYSLLFLVTLFFLLNGPRAQCVSSKKKNCWEPRVECAVLQITNISTYLLNFFPKVSCKESQIWLWHSCSSLFHCSFDHFSF